MNMPNDRLYALLPTVIRQRDATSADLPLRALLSVISEQVDRLEANIGQLYDDWFIETCQDWIVPYIGDLIGYRVLHQGGQSSETPTDSARALNRILIPRQDVANTVRARRRKGTLAALVELAWDVAGYRAVAVEFARLTAITQAVNDLRLDRGRALDVRERPALERIGTIGDVAARTAAVRTAALHDTASLPTSGVGLFVPRYRSFSVSSCTAAWVAQAGDHCFTFSPIENDIRLFAAGPLSLALERGDVARAAFYGIGKSLAIWTRDESESAKSALVPLEKIVPADLSHWRREARAGTVAVDARLGRISFPRDEVPAQVSVAYHYGLGSELGAGEYDRVPVPLPSVPLTAAVDSQTVTFAGECIAGITVRLGIDARPTPATYVTTAKDTLVSVAAAIAAAVVALAIPGVSAVASGAALAVSGSTSLIVTFPQRIYPVSAGGVEAHARLSEALAQWKSDRPARAVIEFGDSEIYDEDDVGIELQRGQALEIRAAGGARPVIRLVDWRASAPDPLRIGGAPDSTLVFDGIFIAGSGLKLAGQVARLVLRRSTFVPGWKHVSRSARRHRVEPSLTVEDASTAICIERCIAGPIVVRRAEGAPRPTALTIVDSIIDAFEHGEALAAPDAHVADVELRIARTTVFGRIRARAVMLAENSIFTGDVTVSDRQHGSVRYCFVPPGSRTPPRYACEPDQTPGVKPAFVSNRFDEPGYAQLGDSTPAAIAQGADDRAEMGVFHDLYRAQRETNLRTRLAEFVPAATDVALLFVL